MTSTSPSALRLLFYLICSYSASILSILIGLTSQCICWFLFDSFGRHEKRTRRKLNWISPERNDEYSVIIVGTGFSGIGTAIRLNQLGLSNYILFERNAHVGGTWYANQYPGCACDVPSNLYSFSFEPNPNWSYFFSRQPEIWNYLEHCADKYRVRPHIRFNTTVTQLKWIEDRQLWEVTTESNHEEKVYYGRSVVLGTGPLSSEAYPKDIDGIEKFEGEMCHTAKWNKNIDFRNKRVAVVGTGASAIQVVPEIQKMGVKQLLVFQRTPPWIVPRVDRRLTDWEKNILKRFPIIQKFIRVMIYWGSESIALSFVYRWPLRIINHQLARYNLKQEIKDPILRQKVTPTWELGCKRMLLTNDWYSTLQKPNVKLVTNRIREVKAHSIVTYDGDEYPVDIIIWSTGFQVQSFPLRVYGINGRSVNDEWSKTIQAYRGVTVPSFPNLYILLGPNTGLGHNSVVIMIESQINYIAEALLYMDRYNLRSIEIKRDVHVEFNKELQSKLKKTVWQSGKCRSWYQDSQGNNTAIWPDFTWLYILMMNKFDYENYITRK